MPDPSPVFPPAPGPEPAPPPPPTPDQVAQVVADARIALSTVQELATLVALAREHNLVGLAGELRAAFARLASAQH